MKINTYKDLPEPNKDTILVFGSNTQGRHGKGSALLAKQKWGAIYGKDKGIQGNSYAIVTKDLTQLFHPSISEIHILIQIDKLYEYAVLAPNKNFYVIYSGKGDNLNGYTSLQMAQMFFVFSNIPNNIFFRKDFHIPA